MEQTGPAIEQIVTNVIKVVASVSAISTLVSLGITQFIKEFTSNKKIIASFAIVFGFFTGITVMKLGGNTWFSPISILVGAIACLGAPGVFSLSKTLGSKQAVN